MSFTNRSFKWAGVLALVVCAAFAVTGCNLFGGDDGDDSGPIYYTVRTNLEYQKPASGTMNIVAAPVVDATEVVAVVNDGIANHNVALTLESSTGAYVGAYAGSSTGAVKGVLIHARKGQLVLRNMVVNPVLNGSVYNCGVTNPTTTAFAQMLLKLTGVEDAGTAAPFTANFFADGLTKKYTVQGAQKTVTELENMFRTSDLFAVYRTYWEKVLAMADTGVSTGNNIIQRAYQENLVEGKTAGDIDSAYAETIGEWVGVTDFYFNNIRAEIDNKEVVEIVGSEKRAYRSITVNLPSYVPYAGIVNFTFFGQNVTIANVAYTGIANALDLSKPVVLVVNGFPKTAGAVANRIYYLVKAVRSAEAVAVNVANSEELKKALASDAQEIVLTGTDEYYIADEPVQWVTQTGFSANKKIYANATGAVVVFHGADVAHLINDPDGTNNGTGWQVVKGNDNVKFVLAARKGMDIYNGLSNTNNPNIANPNNLTNTNRIDEIRLLSDCVFNPQSSAGANSVVLCSSKVLDLNGKVLTGLQVKLGFISGNQATLKIISNQPETTTASRLASRIAAAGYLRSATITGQSAANPAAAPNFYLGSLVFSGEIVIDEDADNTLSTFDNIQVTVNNVAQLEKVLVSKATAAGTVNSIKVILGGTSEYLLSKSLAFHNTRQGYASPDLYSFMIDLNGNTLNLGGYSIDISRLGIADAGYALKLYGTGLVKNGTVISTNGAKYEFAPTLTPSENVTLPTNVSNQKEMKVATAQEFKDAVTAKAGIIVVNATGTLDLSTDSIEFSNDTVIYSTGDIVTIKAKKFTASFNTATSKYYTVQTVNNGAVNVIPANAADQTIRGVYLQAVIGNSEADLRDALNLNSTVKSVANKIYLTSSIALNQPLFVSNVYAIDAASGVILSGSAATVQLLNIPAAGIINNAVTGLKELKVTGLTLAASSDEKTTASQLVINNSPEKLIFDTVVFNGTIATSTVSRLGYQATDAAGKTEFKSCQFKNFVGGAGWAVSLVSGHKISGSVNNTFDTCNIGISGTNYLDTYDLQNLYGFVINSKNTFANSFGPDTCQRDEIASTATNGLGIAPFAMALSGDFYESTSKGYMYSNNSVFEYGYMVNQIGFASAAVRVLYGNATDTNNTLASYTQTMLTYKLSTLDVNRKVLVLTPRMIDASGELTARTITAQLTGSGNATTVTVEKSGENLKITANKAGYELVQVTLNNGKVYLFQVKVD